MTAIGVSRPDVWISADHAAARWPMIEPSPRWIRVRAGGDVVADTRRALLVIQYPKGAHDLRAVPLGPVPLPTYYVPVDDVRPGTLTDPEQDDDYLWWTVRVGGRTLARAAYRAVGPQALAGYVTFDWAKVDWFEEDEHLFAHARDPHKSVHVAASSRQVRVEIEGTVLAESSSPLILFETYLPTRLYLDPDDVRHEFLIPSATTSICPYKGIARYYSVRVGGITIEDAVWSYPEPVPEMPRIAGLLCFRNERVDIIVDGERWERPITPWS